MELTETRVRTEREYKQFKGARFRRWFHILTCHVGLGRAGKSQCRLLGVILKMGGGAPERPDRAVARYLMRNSIRVKTRAGLQRKRSKL